MKKLIIRIVFLIIAILVIVGTVMYCSNKNKEEEIHVSHDMVVHEIVQLGRLEVVKYNIRDIVEYKKVRQWLPNSKTALIVVGEVIGCIDLAKLEAGDIETFGDSVSITLPEPEVCSFKIDHAKSRIYNVENGWWETTQLVDEAYRHAETQLREQAQQMGLTKDSRQNADKILRPLLNALGFNKVHIEFRGELDTTFKGLERK